MKCWVRLLVILLKHLNLLVCIFFTVPITSKLKLGWAKGQGSVGFCRFRPLWERTLEKVIQRKIHMDKPFCIPWLCPSKSNFFMLTREAQARGVFQIDDWFSRPTFEVSDCFKSSRLVYRAPPRNKIGGINLQGPKLQGLHISKFHSLRLVHSQKIYFLKQESKTPSPKGT